MACLARDTRLLMLCVVYERFNADCLAQSMVLNIFTPCLTSLSFFTNKHVNISATRSRFAQVYPVAEDWSSFPSKPQSSALAITVVMCQFNSRCVPRRRRADVPLRHAISPPPHLAPKILTPDFSSPLLTAPSSNHSSRRLRRLRTDFNQLLISAKFDANYLRARAARAVHGRFSHLLCDVVVYDTCRLFKYLNSPYLVVMNTKMNKQT